MKPLQLCSSLICFLAALVLPAAAGAAEALPASLKACMSEADDSRRLSCYDRESARLAEQSGTVRPAGTEPAPAAAPPESGPLPAAAAPPGGEERFGYRGPVARAELDQERERERKFEQLTAKVVELITQPHGELVLTLDNGQVWAQKAPDRSIRVKVGDEVTIRRASLGSFTLHTTTAKGSTRVSRLK